MPATTVVGLDVGSSSIRAVEAVLGRDRPNVTRYGQVALPAGAVQGGVVQDAKAVEAALRQLWTEAAFSTRTVLLGVNHPQVVVRAVDVPALPAKDLKRALPHLVRDALPLPVEEATLDFHPLGEAVKGGDLRGLVIAAPKEAVIGLVRAVESAGLDVASVDLSSFAVLRACAHLAQDSEAVVDFGADITTIVLHTDGTPQIVRTVARGGDDITALLAARLGIATDEAERVKRRHGLLPAPPHTEAAADVDPAGATAVVAEALRPLLAEIRGSFSYFSTNDPSRRVARLALVGGAALLPGLAEHLTAELGVPAFLSDPLQRIARPRHKRPQPGEVDALGRHRSAAAVSVGLTLGATS